MTEQFVNAVQLYTILELMQRMGYSVTITPHNLEIRSFKGVIQTRFEFDLSHRFSSLDLENTFLKCREAELLAEAKFK